MAHLTDAERQELAAAILGRTNINALPKTERAVERIVAARHRVQAEQIATAIEKDAILRDRDSDWRDGMEDAARIAREYPKEQL